MESKEWYRQLNKPSWAPDEKVFGQVWSKLYVIIAAVNIWVVVLLVQGKISYKTALPFWINLGLNLIFTPIQFGLKNNLLAAIDVVLVFVTIIWCMVAIWPHAYWLALAYIPYLVWVAIASTLQISILIKN